MTLFGYSQGAVRAEALARYYAKRYPRVILGGPPRRLKVEHFKHVQAIAVFGGELENTSDMLGGADDLIAAGFRARFFLLPSVDHGDFGGELAGNLALSRNLGFRSLRPRPRRAPAQRPRSSRPRPRKSHNERSRNRRRFAHLGLTAPDTQPSGLPPGQRLPYAPDGNDRCLSGVWRAKDAANFALRQPRSREDGQHSLQELRSGHPGRRHGAATAGHRAGRRAATAHPEAALAAHRSRARKSRTPPPLVAPREKTISHVDGPISERGPSARIGRYALFDQFASGGMATVHFGRLDGAGGFSRVVAIKRLLPHLVANREFTDMLLNEARLAARVRHPNVVATLDVVASKGDVLLVLDYVEGEALSTLCRAQAKEKRDLVPIPIAVGIMQDVLHGLLAIHEATDEKGRPLDLVHRDISPPNVLVGVDGVARVLDFGIAKALQHLDESIGGSTHGQDGLHVARTDPRRSG